MLINSISMFINKKKDNIIWWVVGGMVDSVKYALMQGAKAQASTEYLIIFVVALSIMALAYFLISQMSSSISLLEPTSCEFTQGIACQGAVVASNKTGTVLAFLGNNENSYAISKLSLLVDVHGNNVSIRCSPNVIAPGEPFMCFGKLNGYVPVGTQLTSSIIANTTLCGLDNCQNKIQESYAGKLTTYVSSYKIPKFGIVLSAPQYRPNGEVVKVNLDILGSNFTVERAGISGNFSNTAYSPLAYFVNISKSTSGGFSNVSVSFAGTTANETIILNSQQIRNLYCSQNQTNLLLELLLTAYYSQFITYTGNFTPFTCPLFNNTVYCVSNATSSYASLPNAEYGKWTSTTAYPSASANPFLCLVYNSSIYCFSKSYGYFAQVSPTSGIGTWQQISYPLLLNITSC